MSDCQLPIDARLPIPVARSYSLPIGGARNEWLGMEDGASTARPPKPGSLLLSGGNAPCAPRKPASLCRVCELDRRPRSESWRRSSRGTSIACWSWQGGSSTLQCHWSHPSCASLVMMSHCGCVLVDVSVPQSMPMCPCLRQVNIVNWRRALGCAHHDIRTPRTCHCQPGAAVTGAPARGCAGPGAR
jgi:hypothetical protein